jgi:hypothetical protein
VEPWIGQVGLLRESGTSRILRGFMITARVGDLEKLRAGLRRVCTIDNQQFGNILFRRGARTLSQDLDRHFERLGDDTGGNSSPRCSSQSVSVIESCSNNRACWSLQPPLKPRSIRKT